MNAITLASLFHVSYLLAAEGWARGRCWHGDNSQWPCLCGQDQLLLTCQVRGSGVSFPKPNGTGRLLIADMRGR